MKVRDLQTKLSRFNQDAEIEIVVNNYPQKFSVLFGTSEGCTPENCEQVSFYVEHMCESENNGL
jgi:hypothetical protein